MPLRRLLLSTSIVMLVILGVVNTGDLHAEVVRFAVLIGSNTGSLNEAPLSYAEDDVNSLATVLMKYGRFNEENIVVLKGPGADDLERVLDTTIGRIKQEEQKGNETVFWVYYSGHADIMSLHLSKENYRLEKLREKVEKSPAKIRVLMVDACLTADILTRKGGRPTEPFEIQIDDELLSEGFVLLTAAAPGEASYESQRLKGSVFTHHLITGLLGAADLNKDLKVSIAEAYLYTHSQTVQDTVWAANLQHPTYAYDVTGQEDLVLTWFKNIPDGSGTLRFKEEGAYIISNAETEEVLSEITISGNGGFLVVPDGTYHIQYRGNQYFLEKEVELVNGDESEVRLNEMEEVSYAQYVRKGGERASIFSIAAGAEVRSAILSDFGSSPEIHINGVLSTTFSNFSLGFFLGSSVARNELLTINMTEIGFSLGTSWSYDIGPTWIGLGIDGGASWFKQTFKGESQAYERQNWAPRFGAFTSVGVMMFGRFFVELTGGVRVYFMKIERDDVEENTTPAVPQIGLQVGMFL